MQISLPLAAYFDILEIGVKTDFFNQNPDKIQKKSRNPSQNPKGMKWCDNKNKWHINKPLCCNAFNLVYLIE